MKEKRSIKERAAEELLSWFFPRRCPICGGIVMPKGRLICPECRKKVHVIQQPYCYHCGKPLEQKTTEYCLDCRKGTFSYERGRALFPYHTYIKHSVEQFKFHGRQEYAKWYGKEMAEHLGEFILSQKPDAFIPVPVHRSKRFKRGYNQAELIADELGKVLSVPVDNNSLIRIRKTLPQKELNGKERLKNLEKAFQMRKNVVQYKRVLLVDDIYTTGSTIEACTHVLKQAGIQKVFFVSLCIGYGYD